VADASFAQPDHALTGFVVSTTITALGKNESGANSSHLSTGIAIDRLDWGNGYIPCNELK
jgi:hypothetical protein